MSRRGHYDQYGNFNQRENVSQSNFFSQYVLQAISDTIRSALHNLSDQIKNQLVHAIPTEQPVYIVLQYKNMPNKKDHVNCPICLDDYENSSILSSTDCLHFFHEECLKKWKSLHQTCPICRTHI